MTALGLLLIILAWCCQSAGIEPSSDHTTWDWRDWFTTIPSFVGAALVALGVLIFVWRWMP